MIIIEEGYSLASFNTFGIKVRANIFAEATTIDDLKSLLDIFRSNPHPKLILGGGSNLLFTRDFEGIVIYPNIPGLELVKHCEEFTWLRAYAGECWDNFVEFCTERNLGGVENLSLIPGNVGACPIQNIGAYGSEVKDTIELVETLDLQTGDKRTFTNEECKFGYRDSIFKADLKNKYIITSVVFKLRKQPAIFINYKDVNEELSLFPEINVKNVRQAIINIRRRKLPDPKELGNAGSFFKNPLVDNLKFEEIKKLYPNIPSFFSDNENVKIPAAWLIENCGWKGFREGNVGIHQNQPLVIVNYGEASGKEILDLASKIEKSVTEKFGIHLEMEVNVI